MIRPVPALLALFALFAPAGTFRSADQGAPTLVEVTGRDIPVAENLEGARWFRTEWGWVVAEDPRNAETGARDLRDAVAAFRAHFGVTPGRGAIFETRFAGLSEAMLVDERRWILPWRFIPAANADECAAQAGRDDHHFDRRSALRHELGHLFFLTMIIPNLRKSQYGGDAPDWLDEAAAMAAETERVTAMRRAAFAEQVRAGRLKPASAFLRDAHPVIGAPAMAAAIAAARSRQRGVPVYLEMRIEQLGLTQERIRDFYTQSRATLDYFVERTRDPRILARIARDIRDTGHPTGWTRRSWLVDALAPGAASLDSDFEAWARQVAATHADAAGRCPNG